MPTEVGFGCPSCHGCPMCNKDCCNDCTYSQDTYTMGISEGCEIGFEQWEEFCSKTNQGFGDGTPSPSPTLPRSGA